MENSFLVIACLISSFLTDGERKAISMSGSDDSDDEPVTFLRASKMKKFRVNCKTSCPDKWPVKITLVGVNAPELSPLFIIADTGRMR